LFDAHRDDPEFLTAVGGPDLARRLGIVQI